MALFRSSQGFYSSAEKRKLEDLTSAHLANISTISSKIGCLDDQIARLRLHRDELVSTREREAKKIAILKSMLSPMRRVPTDVLREIFVRCLPEIPTPAAIKILSTYEAPLVLCQVCSGWRRTALACPPLWKALSLGTICTYDDHTPPIISVHPSLSVILDSWFTRAGRHCPLSLGLHFRIDFTQESELTLKLEDVFGRLPISRLQHLALSAVHPSDIFFLSKISQEFTKLESISLQAISGEECPMPVPHRLIQSAPHLHSAELHSMVQLRIFPKSLIPWSQLTHLRVEGQLGMKMWHTLICHCVNLQHGIFSIDDDIPSALTIPTSNHDTMLPYLVDLTIHITEQGWQPDFRQLVFPALRKFQLLFRGQMSMGASHMWNNPFPTSNTDSLRSLVIIGVVEFTQHELRSLLNSSSSITELHLSVGAYYADFFKALASSSHTQQLLPKLEALHCDILDYGDADALLQALISLVQSRWWDELNLPKTSSVARLQRLTVRFHVDVYEKTFMDQASQLLAPFMNQDFLLVLDTWDDHSLNLREMMRYEQE